MLGHAQVHRCADDAAGLPHVGARLGCGIFSVRLAFSSVEDDAVLRHAQVYAPHGVRGARLALETRPRVLLESLGGLGVEVLECFSGLPSNFF